jgi:hypothetical protein
MAWCLACLPMYAMSAIAMLEHVLPAFVFVYVAMPMVFSGLSWLNSESITRGRTRAVLIALAIVPYGPVAWWFADITSSTSRGDIGLSFAVAHGPVAVLYAWWLWWMMSRQVEAAARSKGCPHCGYSKRGLGGGVCPECGEVI